MQTKFKLEWTVTVNQQELNLIGLALSGRLKSDQIESAKELNIILLRQIRDQHAARQKLANDALASLEELI